MAFSKFLCWDPARVHRVMNTNAELANRATFLAIHSEFPLNVSGAVKDDVAAAPKRSMQPGQFLTEFLSPNRNHAQSMVLGESGSGKSHFIKWLQLNIPDDDNRHVIAIPRTGVGLRGIIERILAVLPQDEARPYREELDKAGEEYLTSKDLSYALILNLASVIRGSKPIDGEDFDLATDLIDTLPHVLTDPFVINVFWGEHPLLKYLVENVLTPSSTYGDEDEPRREFEIEDLPLGISNLVNMSSLAQDVVSYLAIDPQSQRMAVDILNRNLDAAIARVVGLSAERLTQLIDAVRRYLAANQKELVLLFEDMALSQGLSGAIFDALTTEGNPEEPNGLCRLRWAGAVTTGYFTAKINETVKTRIEQLVHMDLATSGANAPAKDESVIAFAARYLNAARLDEDSLEGWAAQAEPDRDIVPNACASCEFRAECHEAFGDDDGFGLYPFNRNALLNALGRSDASFEHRFNPRILVQSVLAGTLDPYSGEIEEGRFPTQGYQDQMGGHRVPPAVSQELHRQAPEHAVQQVGILGFWGTKTRTFVDLRAGVYEAFGVSKPAEIQTPPSDEPETQEEATPSRQGAGSRRLDEIEAWGRGDPMRDNLMNHLRPMLFEAIVSHIDWDNEGLLRTRFAGNGMPFRPDSISFAKHPVQIAQRPVMLTVPMTDEPTDLLEAAVALEGLERYREAGSWAFPGGGQRLRSLATVLDKWSNEVVAQISALPGAAGEFDHVGMCVELLATGAALAGRPTQANSTAIDVFNAMFEEWPAEAGQSAEWQALYRKIIRLQPKVRDALLAWTAGSKGGVVSPFVRPQAMMKPLRGVRQHWQLSAAPPEDVGKLSRDYQDMVVLHREISEGLVDVAREEWIAKTKWLHSWRENVAEGTTRKTLVDRSRELVDLAMSKSIPHALPVRHAFIEAIANLEGVQIDDAVRSAAALAEEHQPLERLDELGRGRGANAVQAALAYIAAANRFVSELEIGTGDKESELSEGDLNVQSSQNSIRDSLESVLVDLAQLEGTADSGESNDAS